LSTGNATLDSDVIADGVNVLAYIQQVEQSEPGAFFTARDGVADVSVPLRPAEPDIWQCHVRRRRRAGHRVPGREA
jgi:hypothetical protein